MLLGEVRSLAQQLAFEQKAIIELDLALREIGSNAILHGGGGRATVRVVERSPGDGTGIEVVVSDDGPGIPDVEAALVDGFSTRGGLGLGLGAARRLSDRLTIDTAVDAGTRVVLVKWSHAP